MRLDVGQTQKQAFQILRPPLVAIASGLLTVSGILIAWSVSAKIPEIINGIGTLTPLDSVFSVIAPGDGSVLYPIHYDKGRYRYYPPSWGQKAFDYLAKPNTFDEDGLYQLIEDVINSINLYESERLPVDSANSGLRSEGDDYYLQFKANDVIAIVDNQATRLRLLGSLRTLTESVDLYKQVQQSQKQTLAYKDDTTLLQSKLLARLKPLVAQGAMTPSDFLREQINYGGSKAEQSSMLAQLKEVERQIAQNKVELKNALSDYLRSSVVFANDGGRIDHFVAPQWSEVQPGEEIMAITWNDRLKPNTIPVFVNPSAASLITLGNSTIATPSGFSIAEIGGIKGQVTSISNQPLSPAQLTKRLGSQGLAESVSMSGGYQISVKLEKDTSPEQISQGLLRNRGGYVWNNRSNPPVPPREGMLLNVQITTRRRTPLEMLIPALKEFVGLQEPNQFQKLQTGLK